MMGVIGGAHSVDAVNKDGSQQNRECTHRNFLYN